MHLLELRREINNNKIMIGKTLKALRLEHNLTQTELAKLLSISVSAIGMYETDLREPSDDIKIKIANFFNISVDYLLGVNDYNETHRKVFAQKIKELRIKKQLTQEQVAKAMNISVPALSRYEAGICEPKNLSIICKFAQFYNVSSDYLLGLSDEYKTLNIPHNDFYEKYFNLDENGKEIIKEILEIIIKKIK